MRSERFSFDFGGLGLWGLGLVGSTPLSRPQPPAAVRNASQSLATVRHEVAMAVPMGSAGKAVTFGGFKHRATPFCVGGVALPDIPMCFITCQKSFCVTGAMLLRPFQKMACVFHHFSMALWSGPFSFCVAGATLWTCRVACFWRIPLLGLHQVVATCTSRGRRGSS